MSGSMRLFKKHKKLALNPLLGGSNIGACTLQGGKTGCAQFMILSENASYLSSAGLSGSLVTRWGGTVQACSTIPMYGKHFLEVDMSIAGLSGQGRICFTQSPGAYWHSANRLFVDYNYTGFRNLAGGSLLYDSGWRPTTGIMGCAIDVPGRTISYYWQNTLIYRYSIPDMSAFGVMLMQTTYNMGNTMTFNANFGQANFVNTVPVGFAQGVW